jgi:hypothetical protein
LSRFAHTRRFLVDACPPVVTAPPRRLGVDPLQRPDVVSKPRRSGIALALPAVGSVPKSFYN